MAVDWNSMAYCLLIFCIGASMKSNMETSKGKRINRTARTLDIGDGRSRRYGRSCRNMVAIWFGMRDPQTTGIQVIAFYS